MMILELKGFTHHVYLKINIHSSCILRHSSWWSSWWPMRKTFQSLGRSRMSDRNHTYITPCSYSTYIYIYMMISCIKRVYAWKPRSACCLYRQFQLLHSRPITEKTRCPNHSSNMISNMPVSGPQELAFIEFFSGNGEVWRAVRGSTVTAARVDIDYIENVMGGDNPMDVNSKAGMGFHP